MTNNTPHAHPEVGTCLEKVVLIFETMQKVCGHLVVFLVKNGKCPPQEASAHLRILIFETMQKVLFSHAESNVFFTRVSFQKQG